MYFFKTCLSLLIPVFIGYATLSSLLKNSRTKLKPDMLLALSFGLGIGEITLWMLVLSFLGVRFSFATIGIPALMIGAALIVLVNKSYTYKWSTAGPLLKTHLSDLKKRLLAIRIRPAFLIISVLLSYIFFYIYYICWKALNIPIYEWDAIATIAFKSKVFFFERSLSYMKNTPHPSYPVNVPLMQTWIATVLGGWDDQAVKIVFPAAFISFLMIAYRFIKSYTNRIWALLGIMMLVSSNLLSLHATISYMDLFMLYYNCSTIIMLLLWEKYGDDAFLVLGGVFAGLAAFTKTEGTIYLFIYTVFFIVIALSGRPASYRIFLKKFMKFAAPSYTIALAFLLFKVLKGCPLAERTVFDFTADKIQRIPVIIKTFSRYTFLANNWNIIWLIAAISVFVQIARLKAKRTASLLLVAVLLYLGAWFSLALFTENFIWLAGSEASAVLSRLFLHFYPLLVFLIVLVNFRGAPEDNGSEGQKALL